MEFKISPCIYFVYTTKVQAKIKQPCNTWSNKTYTRTLHSHEKIKRTRSCAGYYILWAPANVDFCIQIDVHFLNVLYIYLIHTLQVYTYSKSGYYCPSTRRGSFLPFDLYVVIIIYLCERVSFFFFLLSLSWVILHVIQTSKSKVALLANMRRFIWMMCYFWMGSLYEKIISYGFLSFRSGCKFCVT